MDQGETHQISRLRTVYLDHQNALTLNDEMLITCMYLSQRWTPGIKQYQRSFLPGQKSHSSLPANNFIIPAFNANIIGTLWMLNLIVHQLVCGWWPSWSDVPEITSWSYKEESAFYIWCRSHEVSQHRMLRKLYTFISHPCHFSTGRPCTVIKKRARIRSKSLHPQRRLG